MDLIVCVSINGRVVDQVFRILGRSADLLSSIFLADDKLGAMGVALRSRVGRGALWSTVFSLVPGRSMVFMMAPDASAGGCHQQRDYCNTTDHFALLNKRQRKQTFPKNNDI